MNDYAKPSFWFQVDRMKQKSNIRPRCWHGVWAPPRPIGSNQRARSPTADKLYYFDGPNGRTLEWDANLRANLGEPTLNAYKNASVYYDMSRFWAVPFDAIRNPVGDRTQGDAINALVNRPENYSLASVVDTTLDWCPIGFDWATYEHQSCVSYVEYGGNEQGLRYVRDNQRWPHELLPEGLRGEYIPITPETADFADYGGLIGELPIIIALIAFSRPPDYVEGALCETMRGLNWQPRVVNNGDLGRGRINQRGVVVRVYSGGVQGTPFIADANQMWQLEHGHYGKLFD